MAMTADRVRKLREMSDDWHRRMKAGLPTDDDALREIAELTNFLACAVPYLLDEIERLSAEREDGGRPRMSTWAKMDGRHGGLA